MRRRWHIRINREGLSVDADINLAVAVNQDTPGATTRESSVSRAHASAGAQEPGGSAESGEPEKHEGDRKEPR
jgi:hypothetical protein